MFNGKDFSARSVHLDNHNHTNLLQERTPPPHLLQFQFQSSLKKNY